MKIKPNKIPEITVEIKFECDGILHKKSTVIKPRITRGGVQFIIAGAPPIDFWMQNALYAAYGVFENYYKENPELEPKMVCACGYDEDDIDDHNSVWGGPGPDCMTKQREAAK